MRKNKNGPCMYVYVYLTRLHVPLFPSPFIKPLLNCRFKLKTNSYIIILQYMQFRVSQRRVVFKKNKGSKVEQIFLGQHHAMHVGSRSTHTNSLCHTAAKTVVYISERYIIIHKY